MNTETERPLPCLKCSAETTTVTLHTSTKDGWECQVCKSMIIVK